jgi:hypothetical protein
MLFFGRINPMTKEQVWGTTLFALFPILAATVFNEALVDRCWRRVIFAALGNARNDPIQMAKNIRAANIDWIDLVQRLFYNDLSFRDFRALLSYVILRLGTALSIASVQLSISWEATDNTFESYNVNRRRYWIIGPVVLHCISLFVVLFVWLMPPWRILSARYDEFGLLEIYKPYLWRIPNGSIANYEQVARFLDPRGHKPTILSKPHKPGVQLKAKLRGIWSGLFFMNVPTGLMYLFMGTDTGQEIGFSYLRFGLHLIILLQNIAYIIALDFVIWNLSLEGLCKDKNTRTNRNMRHLYTSSGLMLLIKAIKQRRPIRASIFLWLFWIQACVMRSFTVLWTLNLAMFHYGYKDTTNFFYDRSFWLAWIIYIAIVCYPVFFLWLIIPFQAPICQQDGWRWAKIAQMHIEYGSEGNYGVIEGQAAWGKNVMSFNEWSKMGGKFLN